MKDCVVTATAPLHRTLGRTLGWALVGALTLGLACRGNGTGAGDPVSSDPVSSSVDAKAPDADEAKRRRMPAGEARPPELALGTRGAVSSAELQASEVGL